VSSEREITIEPPDENSDLVIELPKTLRYDCSSPDGDVVPSDVITTGTMPDLVLASFDECYSWMTQKGSTIPFFFDMSTQEKGKGEFELVTSASLGKTNKHAVG
jgi:hypothetical protein